MAQINKPDEYFNTVLYTGNGTTGHAITGVGFQPDWLWIKERSSTSAAFIYDIIRGVDIKLTPSTTDGDATNSDSMSSFDSDGFTVGVNNAVNENTQTYVAWNWLASTQLHQTQMEVSHQQFQQTLQVDLVLCLLMVVVVEVIILDMV